MANNDKQRSIAIFTGSRAEYGLMRHLITAIEEDATLKLQLIVSGTHLSESHGMTIQEIEAHGFKTAARVPINLEKTPPLSMAALSAEAMAGTNEALQLLKPEKLIVLGDRYETFAAAAAAHLLNIEVVHIHGGETSGGAVDDRLRHAISQLSTWHFTAAEPYRKRVISMGHAPENVFNVGPMVADSLLKTKPAISSEFEKATNYRFGSRNLLVTYHPETLLSDKGVGAFKDLLRAIDITKCNILFTYPNADSGSNQLLDIMKRFIENNPERCWAISSLGQERYMEALQLFDAIAGNSSSGIIEAPLVGMPVLNIGKRQSGRLRFGAVDEAPAEPAEISRILEKLLERGHKRNKSQTASRIRSSPSKAIMTWLRSRETR